MAKPRNKVLDYMAYASLRLFAMFVNMFKWEANYRTERIFADLLFRF